MQGSSGNIIFKEHSKSSIILAMNNNSYTAICY